MTDYTELVKALRCCISKNPPETCVGCTYSKCNNECAVRRMILDAAAAIEALQAELRTERKWREDAESAMNALANKSRGTFECFNCLTNSVAWDADYDFEDYGLEGKGVIHECHCMKCGAQITYYVETEDAKE